MGGNVDKRIGALERLYALDVAEDSAEENERAESRAAEFLRRFERVRERAQEEEEGGDSRRRLALDELEEAIRRRGEAG